MINTVTKNYVDGEFVSYQVTHVNSNMVKSVQLDEANTDYQEIQEWIADGGTVIDGEKFDSVANRILFFDPSKPHHSTSTTDVKRRLNVNINYI